MTEEEALPLVEKGYGKGYTVKVLEVIERKGLTMIRYRVKAIRDGCIEWRVKGWGPAMSGWDFPYKRKF